MTDAATPRTRREPPRYRRVSVRRVEALSPRMLRVAFTGPELAGFSCDEPGASVRLLLPSPGASELVMPTWNGNEFLLADGSRPTIRTFTPRRFDAAAGVLELDMVVHGEGAASSWAARAAEGDEAAVSGPGRGYTVDASAPAFLLAGDETAIPAISQLLEVLPGSAWVEVHVEVGAPDARLELPAHAGAVVSWHDLPAGAPPGEAMVAAVKSAELPEGVRVWAAGEAAAVQRIRKHLFEERGLPRTQASVRGYWKVGRAADGDDS